MKTHIVKSWPCFFDQISSGVRTHELRRNDRDYRRGDRLELHEYDPKLGSYTGHVCLVEVTSLTSMEQPCAVSEEALHPNFCILSVKIVSDEATQQSTSNTSAFSLVAQ